MKIFENGVYRDMTPDEITAMEDAAAQQAAAERHRPLTDTEVMDMLIRQQVQTLEVDDQTALRMRRYYPAFAELIGQIVQQGTKFRAGSSEDADLYKTIQPELLIQEQYPPGEGTESLYTRIDEEHAGDKYDPIPYSGNMELEAGLYYTQDGVLYH
ncbi:MAG TPA: hypothetical protein H9745_06010, partial [Candidatus Agathobaculum stercoravium]|nr:hypothetical protein [Candidatus Agathobaculum stercoravium]